MLVDFHVAEPLTKRNQLLGRKGFRNLLLALPLRSIPDHVASQKQHSRPQRRIAGPPRNQAANENQLQPTVGLGAARFGAALRAIDPRIWNVKQVVEVRGKFGACVR